MREFKFRAWDEKEKIMLNHNRLFRLDTSNEVPFLPLLEKFTDKFKVMQYTGLKDLEGNEIYEGDLVEYFKEELCEVKFLHGSFVVEGIKTGYRESFFNLNGQMKVVRNVYENKEGE